MNSMVKEKRKNNLKCDFRSGLRKIEISDDTKRKNEKDKNKRKRSRIEDYSTAPFNVPAST
jgi:hypothetical protein